MWDCIIRYVNTFEHTFNININVIHEAISFKITTVLLKITLWDLIINMKFDTILEIIA